MTVQTIRMVRDPACNPQPHSADVHPEMVDMWRTAGYVLPSEARFEIADAQPELQLNQSAEEIEQAKLKAEAEEAAKNAPRDENGLRTDGPTLTEYVAAGYAAENYPPQDYAVKPEAAPVEPLPPNPFETA